MTPSLRWVILGIICICIVVYLTYANWPVSEPFTDTAAPPPTLTGDLRECTVYYTKNVDICDRPNFIPSSEEDTLENAVDRGDAMNYYSLGKTDVSKQHERLAGISETTRTHIQTNALENLKRVLADIDSLPFKNTCKLEMTNLKETNAHPFKINVAGEGTERRGNPIHWSFCYYPTAADTTPGAVHRISPETRADPRFTRVFQDTQAEYRSTSGLALQRYDMRSLYNDDLINLHCFLYENNAREGGGSISAFQGTQFMEIILDRTQVLEGTSKTLRIIRMRPVKIQDGMLVVSTTTKNAYLSFLELVRTQNSLIHRLKSYPITVYKLMFHLCTAQAKLIEGSNAMPQLAHNKYIQLAIPKPMKRQGSAVPLLSFKQSYTSDLQIYDFITNPPNGDISDMTFDIAELDNRIPI
jgi:hypothetical protein